MIPACFATLLWSFCVVASHRSVAQLGEIPANFWRMVVAVLLMGLISHAAKVEFQSTSFWYLFLSGVVGFGIGDLGLYFALSRIGSRLTILMAQCVAVPIAFTIEWLWLGNLITWAQAGAICIILCGIVLALIPRHLDVCDANRKRFFVGILFGLLAAIGQAGGGVLSRIAYEAQGLIETESTLEGILMGTSAGYQRLIGGFLFITVVYFLTKANPKWKISSQLYRAKDPASKKFFWMVTAALSGPVIGIAFFQWALITTETAIVQSIVALTPIVIIPFAYWIEGERPKPRSVIGGVIAVCGALLLAFHC